MNESAPKGTRQRLEKAVRITEDITKSFESAAQDFAKRELKPAQEELSEGVDTLTTFINWYLLVLRSDQERLEPVILQIDAKVIDPIQKACEELAGSEIYSSSTALGIAIGESLLPRLRELHNFTQAALDYYLREEQGP